MKLFVFTTILQVLSVAGARSRPYDGKSFKGSVTTSASDPDYMDFYLAIDGRRIYKDSIKLYKSDADCTSEDCVFDSGVTNAHISFDNKQFFLYIAGSTTEIYDFASITDDDCSGKPINECDFTGTFNGTISFDEDSPSSFN
ncbi:hypothetical protein AX774_g44 [Zancudomyces culisetae]|uniref:Uncharacterized protein n=1 Tax=Zancudomyces culisetae TaxID=1213189 RepID=A0A1R1PZN0_ZANCU|nr:hypothetical protein AX774_g44 [Zancudomyces culisetae]|eukprot:OMH86397.1 hypothetical protein AX774_g44 [Zancudomyces culisetae]